MKPLDITGQRFGRLIAFRRLGKNKHGCYVWLFDCDCGGFGTATINVVRMGNKQSCGCLVKDVNRGNVPPRNDLPRGRASFNRFYESYERGAKHRGIDLNISKEEFWEIVSQDCYYCGAEPRIRWHGKSPNGPCRANGIDRKDNSKGYEKDNVVPCCTKCNRAKNNLHHSVFLSLVTDIYNHRVKQEDI